MAKSKEDEEKLRREKLELLKMKQGLIEESEIIPQNEQTEKAELHGFEKISNFFYHNLWIIVPVVLAAALAVFLTVQILTREKADLEIFVAVTEESSPLLGEIDIVEETLERFCPDFDGNGKVHVSVQTIDLSMGDAMVQYADIEREKLTSAIEMCERSLALTDKGFLNNYLPKLDYGFELYTDFTGKFPADILYNGKGVLANKTYADFSEKYVFLVREIPDNSKSNSKTVIEQRERALTVLNNLIEGNIVNP